MKTAAAIACVLLACGGGKDGDKKGGSTKTVDDDGDPIVEAQLKVPDEPGRSVKVDVPAVPVFELPPPYGDGSRSVKEVRVAGKKLLETELSVTGVVTWVYDCVDANRSPGRTEAETRKMIEDDQTLCERPKFYVGDTIDTPPEHSLWVVEVPRPYTPMELKREFKKKESRDHPRRCDPEGKPADSICPPRKIGDKVVVTGKLALRSGSGEANSDGLLVYARMKNVTTSWVSPRAAPYPDASAAAPPPPPTTPPKPEEPLAVQPGGPMKVKRSLRDKAAALVTEAATASAHAQHDVAIKKYEDALKVWPEHHVAVAGLAVLYAKKKDYVKAARLAEQATKLVPDAGMYRMLRGVYLYESTVANARAEMATAGGGMPTDDYLAEFAKAEQELATAVKLAPHLWRAHFVLGKIHGSAGRTQRAAEAYTQAVTRGASEVGPWVQLAELYRRWDLNDHAIKVAEQGAQVVVGNDVAQLWFSAGSAYFDKKDDAKALQMLTRALELRRDFPQAKFMRGQVYFRRKEFAEARRELEEAAKSGRLIGFYQQQVASMLAEIAAAKP
jgi:tetratricopeptide (TPR) repeat protein